MKTKGICPKCIGSGMTQFSHIEGGRCFGCGGSGYIYFDDEPQPEQPITEGVKVITKEVLILKSRYQVEKVGDRRFTFYGLDRSVENHCFDVDTDPKGMTISFRDGVKRTQQVPIARAVKTMYKG